MSKKFYGIELSEYEISYNRVSYRTLANCFDAVLCNNITQVDELLFDNIESGELCYYENENGESITQEEYEAIIENGGEAYEHYKDIYQYYIVSDKALYLLKKANELVLYSEVLDCYIWCIDHFGTAWSGVLTSLKINKEGEE